jgi:predicted RecA/RadA family phage recombinase
MADYVQAGCLIDHTPSSAVAVGGVVVLNDLVCVAPVAIAANALGAVAVDGVWSMPKAAAASNKAISQGALVYWDATNGNITTTSTDNKRAGKAAKAASTTDTTVQVIINVG